jgi:hypothetical protein
MPNPPFHDQVRSWFREHLGEDPFPDGIPHAPPDWLLRSMQDPAVIARNWALFRDRWQGVAVRVIAERHGIKEPQVHALSQQVVYIILRARRQDAAAPSDLPQSVLARDCATFNAVWLGVGYGKLRVADMVRVGIDETTPLSRVPDEQLLRVRGMGPKTVAAIRRLFPFEE